MAILHAAGRCWCRKKHSALQAFVLNTRDIPAVAPGTPKRARVKVKRGRPPKRG